MGLNPEQRQAFRLEKASPLLDELFAWVKKTLKTATVWATSSGLVLFSSFSPFFQAHFVLEETS